MLNAIKRTFFFTLALFSFPPLSVYTGFLTILVKCMLKIIHKSKIPVSVWILLNCTELSYFGCLLQNVCKVSAKNLQIQIFVKTDCSVHVLNVMSLCCWLASAPESWRQNPKTERAGGELPIPRNDNFCEMVSTFISVRKILKGLLSHCRWTPPAVWLLNFWRPYLHWILSISKMLVLNKP